MAEALKVAVFEDDDIWLDIFKTDLESLGHLVVVLATTFDEAQFTVLPQLIELGIQVALIDGKLSEEGYGTSQGSYIGMKIKEVAPDIIRIGVSSAKTQENIDHLLGKEHYSKEALKNLLSSL